MTQARCGQCGGRGEVQDMEVRQHGRYQMQWADCDTCNGTGTIAMPEVVKVSEFEIDGRTVNPPGFEREGFITFVNRAKDAQLRTVPAGTPGTVMVVSGSSDARYAVTRRECACPGHRRHHRCWHRAYVIWLADVQGVDVTRIPTIGVSKRGLPRTFGCKLATKGWRRDRHPPSDPGADRRSRPRADGPSGEDRVALHHRPGHDHPGGVRRQEPEDSGHDRDRQGERDVQLPALPGLGSLQARRLGRDPARTEGGDRGVGRARIA